MYAITQYTYNKANELGVVVKPSKNPKKKIDVYKDGKLVASVGAIGYKDYPTYLDLEKKGIIKSGTANKRRQLYKLRHKNDLSKIGSAGYYADRLLW